MDQPEHSEIPLSKADALGFSVLRLLEENPHITQRELAAQLGLSLGRANYCLAALAEKGLIKIENFRASPSKWRYAYILTPKGLAQKAALTGKFLARKLREYDALRAEIEALRSEVGAAAGEHGGKGQATRG